jgi:hypothetical protein
MANVHFLTFANTTFMSPDRIISQAKSFNIFNTITAANEHTIPEYIQKHLSFINFHRHGYGRYIWKPKIIYDKLLEINDNDILLYCDAGIHLNINGKSRFLEYLNMLNTSECLAFLTSDRYKVNFFCKNDAIMSYYPDLQNQLYPYMYAGIVFLKKTPRTLQLIKNWLDLCETYNFLDTSPSRVHKEKPYFLGQDADNGLFGICVHKHSSIIKFIDHTESCIYHSNGLQYYNCTDWSSLDKFPIQCRRDRPAR